MLILALVTFLGLASCEETLKPFRSFPSHALGETVPTLPTSEKYSDKAREKRELTFSTSSITERKMNEARQDREAPPTRVRIGRPLVTVTRPVVSGALGSNDARLECFIDSFPKSTNFWLKDDIERLQPKKVIEKYTITEDSVSHFQFRDRLRLQIINLTVEDLGNKFRCMASNQYGTGTGLVEVTANSFLESKPIPANGFLEVGFASPAVLHCEIKAHPLAVTYWFRNSTGEQLMWSDDYHVTEHKISSIHYLSSLHIRSVANHDFTTFSCISKNSFGEKHNAFRILEKTSNPLQLLPSSGSNTFVRLCWFWILVMLKSLS